jgi:ATPase subunit of ABC transporter with duplicated ATPase domains
MTTLITFDQLGFQHPNGQSLFQNLNGTIGCETIGLIGDNGVGKTTLARLLAGELSPTQGRIHKYGTPYYLPQQIQPNDKHTLAELMGIRTILDALQRIEQGSIDEADFEQIGARWDLRQQAQAQLERYGLKFDLDTSCNRLSGGELTRVALIGVFLSEADLIILDEPTNHLDIHQRQILFEQIKQWKKGLLVISHDIQLLNQMDRILELSTQGLTSFGGNYDFYQLQKTQQQQALQAKLDQAKQQRKVEMQTLQRQQERQQKKQAAGARAGKQANQAKILLDRQKERSQQSSGKLNKQIRDSHSELNEQVKQASQAIAKEPPRYLFAPDTQVASNKQILNLRGLVLPYNLSGRQGLNFDLVGAQRVALIGPNGCGKSTLLKIIGGLVPCDQGQIGRHVAIAYIDQHASQLQADISVLEQLKQTSGLSESEARQRLAQIGLTAAKVTLRSDQLSGGERIKAALLCALYRQPAPQLLLLDEPNNHIDLATSQALIEMLNQYQGALIIVSHDMAFLNQLNLTDKLQWQTKHQPPNHQAW